MPNSLQLFPQNYSVTHDPTATLLNSGSNEQVQNIIGEGIPNFLQATEQVIASVINSLLHAIDQVTGLDLLGFAQLLERLLGIKPPPGGGSGGTAGTTSGGGAGKLLTGLGGYVAPKGGDTGQNVYHPIANVLEKVLNLIDIPIDIAESLFHLGGLFGTMHTNTGTAQATGDDAQYSADTANSGVALLNAKGAGTGTVFTDTFNEAANTNLGANYDRAMGSGSGTWGPDGTGNVVWTAANGTSQTCLDRVTTAMTTKYQSAAIVLTRPPSAGHVNAQIALGLRMNAAKTTYAVGVINPGSVEVGYVNSGIYTRLGAPVSVAQHSGDLWEFRAGTVTDVYELLLLQNNLTVCDRLDGSHLSQAGSASTTWVGTYDYGALIATAGFNFTFLFIFFPVQIPAPTGQVLTFADRTP